MYCHPCQLPSCPWKQNNNVYSCSNYLIQIRATIKGELSSTLEHTSNFVRCRGNVVFDWVYLRQKWLFNKNFNAKPDFQLNQPFMKQTNWMTSSAKTVALFEVFIIKISVSWPNSSSKIGFAWVKSIDFGA